MSDKTENDLRAAARLIAVTPRNNWDVADAVRPQASPEFLAALLAERAAIEAEPVTRIVPQGGGLGLLYGVYDGPHDRRAAQINRLNTAIHVVRVNLERAES